MTHSEVQQFMAAGVSLRLRNHNGIYTEGELLSVISDGKGVVRVIAKETEEEWVWKPGKWNRLIL